MKKTLVILIALITVLSCMTSALASGTKTFVTTGTAYMRAAADKESKKLAELPKGTKLNATDWDTDSRGVKWYYGSYKDQVGYLSEKNLKAYSEEKKEEKKDDKETKKNVALITTGSCNMRKDADKGSAHIITLPEGTSFKSTKSKVDSRGVRWYYGEYKGKKGYVSEKYLKKDNGEVKKNVSLVTTGSCNMRKDADKSAAHIITLPEGASFKSTKSKLDSRGVRWYYGEYKGKKGYVSEKNLKKAAEPEEKPTPKPTAQPTPKPVDYSGFTDVGCYVRVISKTLNMRMAPSTDYGIVHTYENGSILYAARTNGSWAEVDDSELGLHGYVSVKYVEVIEAAKTVLPLNSIDTEAPADGIYPAIFTAADDYRDFNGSRMLTLRFRSMDIFDIAEVDALKKGDTIVIGGEDVLIDSIHRGIMVEINGTYILQAQEESNCFIAFTADGTVYTVYDETALPVAEDVIITDGMEAVEITQGIITDAR